MSPLLLLPSIAIGLFYGLTTGNYLILLASVLSGLVAWLVSRRKAAVPEGELRLAGQRVWLGEKRLPKHQIFWSKAQHLKVIELFSAQSLPSLDGLRSLRAVGWYPGEASAYLVGLDKVFRLDQGAGHLLVIGPTGSGKSELIHLVIASLDDSVALAVADYKGGAVLTELPWITLRTSDIEPQESQNVFWKNLIDELGRREQFLREQGVANWDAAERLGVSEPRRLVVVDEAVAAIRSSNMALDAITRIATKGRSLGVHLLLTTQSLVGLPREILINLRSRLALAGTDDVELLQLGCKDKIGVGSSETKAAVLMHDGQTFAVQVPLGARKAPRSVA
ncbi:MAG: FtsK/SpoIIIE domain-containing protein [Rhodoluna sp.]|nr:FtsK/SpoIIIE domain-containing protein [Rhodoluna sp.]